MEGSGNDVLLGEDDGVEVIKREADGVGLGGIGVTGSALDGEERGGTGGGVSTVVNLDTLLLGVALVDSGDGELLLEGDAQGLSYGMRK